MFIQRKLEYRKTDRRGVQILEFILVMPVFFILLLAGIQFSLTQTVRGSVANAATEAARSYGTGADLTTVSTVVNNVLTVHSLSLGTGVRLIIEDDAGVTQSAGDSSILPSASVAPPSGTVRARVMVTTDAAPLPNLLKTFCLDFSGRRFETSVVTRVQCP